MKVLALNSSPRGGDQSKTELMLAAVVRGMEEAGAEVEVVHLRKKKINNCIGCYTCWTKTPGTCLHRDDMTGELFPKWSASDLVVYASPLYHFTLNAAMKAFIERTLPIAEPFLKEHKDGMTHPLRQRPPAAVVLSVAGFPQESVFAQLSSWANFVFARGLVGEIYRPGAEAMSIPVFRERTEAVLAAATQAGRELIASMRISPETQARLRQPICDDPRQLMEMANLFWKACIEKGKTPKEMRKE